MSEFAVKITEQGFEIDTKKMAVGTPVSFEYDGVEYQATLLENGSVQLAEMGFVINDKNTLSITVDGEVLNKLQKFYVHHVTNMPPNSEPTMTFEDFIVKLLRDELKNNGWINGDKSEYKCECGYIVLVENKALHDMVMHERDLPPVKRGK